MNIIILNSRKYDFTDLKTNRQITGMKIQYLFNDDMEPIIVDQNEKGYQVADGTLSLDKEYSVKHVPGVYDAQFVTRVNAKNQPIQKLVDVNFVSTLPELFGAPPAKKIV
ncbi:MAG: hypothetical protein QW745_07700 [Thermoplasmata archaeon]